MRNGKLVATIADDGENTELEIISEGIRGGDALHIAKNLIKTVAEASGDSVPDVLISLTLQLMSEEDEVETTEES